MFGVGYNNTKISAEFEFWDHSHQWMRTPKCGGLRRWENQHRLSSYLLFLMEIPKKHVRQTGSGINFRHCSFGKIALMWRQIYVKRWPQWGQWKSNVKPWAIDWHHDLWLSMTLNCPRSRSQNLHIKYLECDERYNVEHNGSHTRNHQWSSKFQLALRPLTLDNLELS